MVGVDSRVDGFFDQSVGCIPFIVEYFLADPIKQVVLFPAIICDFVLFDVAVLNCSLVFFHTLLEARFCFTNVCCVEQVYIQVFIHKHVFIQYTSLSVI